jgi:hypothetical protein
MKDRAAVFMSRGRSRTLAARRAASLPDFFFTSLSEFKSLSEALRQFSKCVGRFPQLFIFLLQPLFFSLQLIDLFATVVQIVRRVIGHGFLMTSDREVDSATFQYER